MVSLFYETVQEGKFPDTLVSRLDLTERQVVAYSCTVSSCQGIRELSAEES